MFRLLLISRRT